MGKRMNQFFQAILVRFDKTLASNWKRLAVSLRKIPPPHRSIDHVRVPPGNVRVPRGTTDHSPAFQRWDHSIDNVRVPRGTAEFFDHDAISVTRIAQSTARLP